MFAICVIGPNSFVTEINSCILYHIFQIMKKYTVKGKMIRDFTFSVISLHFDERYIDVILVT